VGWLSSPHTGNKRAREHQTCQNTPHYVLGERIRSKEPAPKEVSIYIQSWPIRQVRAFHRGVTLKAHGPSIALKKTHVSRIMSKSYSMGGDGSRFDTSNKTRLTVTPNRRAIVGHDQLSASMIRQLQAICCFFQILMLVELSKYYVYNNYT
jgi:hypothetical protein